MMLSERGVVDFVTEAALMACDADVKARHKSLWLAATIILADVLRNVDPFTRERLLQGLDGELRESMAHLDELLCPLPRNPFKPN
jgi:hypothetical protein